MLPSDQSQFTYAQLHSSELYGYRVTHKDSLCRYDKSHGFTAKHPSFRHDDGTPVTREDLEDFFYLFPKLTKDLSRSAIVHGVESWRYPDDIDIWISITLSIEWALWQIIRRLRLDEYKEVFLHIIRLKPALTYLTRDGETRSASIRTAEYVRSYNCAHSLAVRNHEVLVFGRIFEEDVVEVTRWTREVHFVDSS